LFFIKGICQFPTSVGVPPGSAHFRALDRDHDGLVSRSEFARGAGTGRSGLRVAAERVTQMAESEATEAGDGN